MYPGTFAQVPCQPIRLRKWFVKLLRSQLNHSTREGADSAGRTPASSDAAQFGKKIAHR
jgi:hypothetical protein